MTSLRPSLVMSYSLDSHRHDTESEEMIRGYRKPSCWIIHPPPSRTSDWSDFLLGVVPCPVDPTSGLPCAGHPCLTSLGRCVCGNNTSLDDCSANGVFWISESEGGGGVPSEHRPVIPVNDWAFWGFTVGCEELEFLVTLDCGVHDAADADGGDDDDQRAAPLLVIRRGVLPLMVESTLDYEDYYSGRVAHGPHQAIFVRHESLGLISGRHPGTVYSTGSPEPGIYYIGVFNDPSLATGPLQNYNVTVTVMGVCATCYTGFMMGPDDDDDRCSQVCPGVIPTQAYSNSPNALGSVCGGHGSCEIVTLQEDRRLKQAHNRTAAAATATAAAAGQNHRGGGQRKTSEVGEAAQCVCDVPFGGVSCDVTCPVHEGSVCNGRGSCRRADIEEDKDLVGSKKGSCECFRGFVGVACEFVCPRQERASVMEGDDDDDDDGCSGHGKCIVNRSSTTRESLGAACVCASGFTGNSCGVDESSGGGGRKEGEGKEGGDYLYILGGVSAVVFAVWTIIIGRTLARGALKKREEDRRARELIDVYEASHTLPGFSERQMTPYPYSFKSLAWFIKSRFQRNNASPFRYYDRLVQDDDDEEEEDGEGSDGSGGGGGINTGIVGTNGGTRSSSSPMTSEIEMRDHPMERTRPSKKEEEEGRGAEDPFDMFVW